MDRIDRRFALAGALVAAFVLAPLTGSAQGGGQGRGGSQAQRGPRVQSVRLIGVVTSLNPSAGFVLQDRSGREHTIAITASTTVVSGETGDTVLLTEGRSVTVEGTYDRATDTITAAAVTLNDYIIVDDVQARGTVASVDAAASSFVLTVDSFGCGVPVEPTGDTITVVTNASTKFVRSVRGRRQATAAFSDVAAGGTVEVKGSFDTTTQTLTAEVVSIR